jgi:hypothetical protein
MAAAIDKFVYITLHQTFQKGLIVKYSKMEQVEEIEQVQHPIIRESLKLMGVTDPHPGDHLHGRHSRRHRARLQRQLHHGPAQGPAHPPKAPRPHARTGRAGLPASKSKKSASPSANRTNTSPRMAASPAFSFFPTIRSK